MATDSLVMLSLPADPTDPDHAVNKNYVDTNFLPQATADTRYVNNDGDMMTGSLKISTPAALNSLWLNGPGDVGIEWDSNYDPKALKFIVPQDGWIDCDGATMANAHDPFGPTDLTTKQYVDAIVTVKDVDPVAGTDIPSRDGLIWMVVSSTTTTQAAAAQATEEAPKPVAKRTAKRTAKPPAKDSLTAPLGNLLDKVETLKPKRRRRKADS